MPVRIASRAAGPFSDRDPVITWPTAGLEGMVRHCQGDHRVRRMPGAVEVVFPVLCQNSALLK